MAEDALVAQPIAIARANTDSENAQKLTNFHKLRKAIRDHSKVNVDKERILPRGAERDIFSIAIVRAVLEEALGHTSPSLADDIIEQIYKHNVRTLAVLIWHGDQSTNFSVLVKHARSQIALQDPSGLDKKLPLSEEQAHDVWPEEECSIGDSFVELQKLVTVHIIEEGESNVFKKLNESSPILERKIISEIGTTSVVYRIKIAKGGWLTKPRFGVKSLSDSETIFALKAFKGTKSESERRMHVELRVLEKLDKSGTSHRNALTNHHGTLKDDREASLILPYGEQSLGDHFSTEDESNRDYQYGTMKESLTAFAGITDGIRHFHDGINISGNKSHVFQQDLQPSNMLFVGTDLTLADYGLAVIAEEEVGNLDNNTNGTYAAPDKRLSKASEGFSLACILLDFISYKIGGPRYLSDFENRRKAQSRPSNKNQFWFYREDGSPIMNPAVKEWIEEMKTRADQWDIRIGKCIKHILDTLAEDAFNASQHRVDDLARKINKAIHVGLEELKNQEREPPRPERLFQEIERPMPATIQAPDPVIVRSPIVPQSDVR